MKIRTLLATLITAGVAGGAFAADSADIKVKAAVAENCKISSTQDISFGTLDPAQATDASAKGGVTFACTKNVNYTLSAGNGEHFDAAASTRRMKGADQNFLPYAIAQSTFTGQGQGFGNAISVALDAKVAGSDYRNLPADSYLDTVVLTIKP